MNTPKDCHQALYPFRVIGNELQMLAKVTVLMTVTAILGLAMGDRASRTD
ncbi:MAG: hypothetical protein AAF827_05375 [Cyanobacteria bacterium P01_D01_bin.6]